MTNPLDRNRDFPAPGAPSSGSRGQQTALLGDIPDVAMLMTADAAASSAASADSGFGLAALAALAERYDILGEAGHGAMGTVYKARDRETQQVVALKLVKPEFASDQTMMDRFKNELLFARKITHKGVCRVYEFNRIGGVAYTSMEFVEGESLRSVLERFGGLPLRKALDLTLQICSGLKEAHAQGIVHRDLKPENVMIDGRGNVKIMDFGIARSMESATRITGAMIGTPAYMAPEQVSGKQVDYRTDIYSLGLLLYEVFTGKPAFAAENPVAVALKQVQGTPVPPHEIEPTIPVSVERAILKCLEKDPGKRFQSVAELESAVTSSGTRAVLASSRGTSPMLANREAVARTMEATVCPIGRPAQTSKRTAILVWVFFGACIVAAGASGMRWASVSRAAKNLTAPASPAAPLPPDFALEKYEPRSVAAAVRPQPARDVSEDAPESEATASGRPAEAARESSPPPSSVTAGSSAALAAPVAQTPSAASAAAVTVAPRAAATPYRASVQAGGAGFSANAAGLTYLWIGRFQQEDSAQEAAKRIDDLGLPTMVVPRRNPNGEVFVVLSGPYGPKKAPDVMQQLESLGFANIRAIRNLNLPQRTNP